MERYKYKLMHSVCRVCSISKHDLLPYQSPQEKDGLMEEFLAAKAGFLTE